MGTISFQNCRHNFGFLSLFISVKISVLPFHHFTVYLQCSNLNIQGNWKSMLFWEWHNNEYWWCQSLEGGFWLPSTLRRLYDQLVCNALQKSRLISSSFLIINLEEMFMKNSEGKGFLLAWYDFPKLGITITCHTETKWSKISYVYLISIFLSIHREALESSGWVRSVFPSGYVMIIQWIVEMYIIGLSANEESISTKWLVGIPHWWPPCSFCTATVSSHSLFSQHLHTPSDE